jgi:hypothetical protein
MCRRNKLLLTLGLTLGLLAGCKSPFDRTRDASNGGATGTITGSRSLIVFSNELMTGGGAFLYPGGENQSLTFADTSNPVSARSIRYVWNGGNVSSQFGPEHTFAGFDLMNTSTQADYGSASNTGRDLRAAGYTKVNFFARASLSSNTLVKVEVAAPSTNPAPCIAFSTDGTLDDTLPGGTPCGVKRAISSNWGSFTISIVPATHLGTVKDFFKATFIYVGAGTGSGGTVYFDNIEYAP